MQLIDRETLKATIDRGDPIQLVMALDDWAFRAKHIPGSRRLPDRAAAEGLSRDDDIVVYCSGPDCAASQIAYAMLVANGFERVRRYAGGIVDWEAAGYPLEGALVA